MVWVPWKRPQKSSGWSFPSYFWGRRPTPFSAQSWGLFDLFSEANKEHSEGERLRSPAAWLLLPPLLSSNPGCFQALPDAYGSHSGVGGCLAKSGSGSRHSPLLHTPADLHKHTKATLTNTRAHSQPVRGQAHTETQVNMHRNTCPESGLFILSLFIFCLNHLAQNFLKAGTFLTSQVPLGA